MNRSPAISPTGDLTILVLVDVSGPETPTLAVLDLLHPFEAVLLGYFPVPDQAEPALIKDEYEPEGAGKLDDIANGRSEFTEVLVFTHDREATIDRVVDQYDCDVVLSGGDTDEVDRILVPIRGDVSLERIDSVAAGLLRGSDATATFFHSVAEDDESSQENSSPGDGRATDRGGQ